MRGLAKLEAVRCQPCRNDREQWFRVWTVRGGEVLTSELSPVLARRLLPRLCERHGITDQAGLFVGSVKLVRS